MLEWLRKLMAGDQSAVPSGATVERDGQGRVTQVKQSLSLARSSQDAPAHPSLVLPDSLAPRLAEACDWMARQNVRLARLRGIGLERNQEFDQETGRLTLKFGRGRKIIARAQILGSFDPRDRSFMWGWANPSVRAENCEDAGLLKALGEQLGVAALTTPVQTIAFDNLMPLLAFGARNANADGVYRCMVNGSTSIFLTLHIEDSAGKDRGAAAIDDAVLDAAQALAASYDAEMLPLDLEYRQRKDEEGVLQELLERKMAVYGRYWSRDDDYWEPCSFGWPSDHDPHTKKLRFAVPHPEGGALEIAIAGHVGQTVYRIEQVDGALRITDMLLDWGEGFIWPSTTAPAAA